MTDADERARSRQFHSDRARDVSRRAEIEDGFGKLPTIYELRKGMPFHAGDASADLQQFIVEMAALAPIRGRLPRALMKALDMLAAAFTAENMEHVRKLAGRSQPHWSADYRSFVLSVARRIDVYLTYLGDPEAAARVAVETFVDWSERERFAGYGTVAAFDEMISCLAKASPFGGAVHFHATRAAAKIRRAIELETGAERVPAEEPPKASVLADVEVEDADALAVVTYDDTIETDRAGIVRWPAGKRGPSASGPSLMVLTTVSHLPGKGDDGTKPSTSWSSHSPRTEFAPIAGVRLPLVTGVAVEEVAMTLRAEYPWARDAIDALLSDLVGREWTRFRSTLLVGTPGCGKTRLARRLAELCGLATTVFPCAGVADASFGGTSRQWGTGRASVPLQAIKNGRVGNPAIVLDEIEKAGTRTDNGRLVDTLIPMLEAESSSRYFDPYVESAVDLSAISWIATANALDGIPEPLRDRMRILRVPEPSAEHLGDIVRRIVDELRRERDTDEMWMPDLDPDEVGLISDRWSGGSLRLVRRLVETVVAGRDALAARH